MELEPLEEYDYSLALALQAHFDKKDDSEDDLPDMQHLFKRDISSKSVKSIKDNGIVVQDVLNKSNIMDPALELLDPNPDIRALFLTFNKKYFWGKLDMVEVRWSPRMTLCAGICCYEGGLGLCSIRLSQPLLKLRPRKDLVETLLHEMIHAYLFITQNNKDHDGHGPEFHKHMYRINKASGANITVYHNFHDEVDAQRTHWWKCNGPCQFRPPYYGIVKRSMNRAPAPRDTWWEHHKQTCGGVYTKIKEPDNYKNKSKGGITKKVTQCQSVKDSSSSHNDTLDRFLERNHNDNNKVGGVECERNPRGIPLNSRLLQNSSIPYISKKGKYLTKIKVPQSAAELSRILKLAGKQSTCIDAPAFNMIKPLQSLKKKIKFYDSDDENMERKTFSGGTKKEGSWNPKYLELKKNKKRDSFNVSSKNFKKYVYNANATPISSVDEKSDDSSDDCLLVSLINEPAEKKRKLSLPSNTGQHIPNFSYISKTPKMKKPTTLTSTSTATSSNSDNSKQNYLTSPLIKKIIENTGEDDGGIMVPLPNITAKSCFVKDLKGTTKTAIHENNKTSHKETVKIQENQATLNLNKVANNAKKLDGIFCPVCNKNIFTSNINAHIDTCLTLTALENGDI